MRGGHGHDPRRTRPRRLHHPFELRRPIALRPIERPARRRRRGALHHVLAAGDEEGVADERARHEGEWLGHRRQRRPADFARLRVPRKQVHVRIAALRVRAAGADHALGHGHADAVTERTREPKRLVSHPARRAVGQFFEHPDIVPPNFGAALPRHLVWKIRAAGHDERVAMHAGKRSGHARLFCLSGRRRQRGQFIPSEVHNVGGGKGEHTRERERDDQPKKSAGSLPTLVQPARV